MLTDFFKKTPKVSISLPNFHSHVFLNLCFITLQKSNKKVFKEDFCITAADGCFSYSIWSTVRNTNYTTAHDMETTINFYSKNNIAINYIFDNDEITQEDLKDRYSNLMLKLAHKKGNGVYVKSDILYCYIQKEYPLYKLIKIAGAGEFKKKNIAVEPKYNNGFNLFDIKYKGDAYITLNPMCPVQCKHYEEHRKYICKEQLGYYRISDTYMCPLRKDLTFYDVIENSNCVTETKMADYIKSGFRNFRIDFPYISNCIDIQYGLYDTIESYIYYLIKPEYREEIRNIIIRKYAGKNNG